MAYDIYDELALMLASGSAEGMNLVQQAIATGTENQYMTNTGAWSNGTSYNPGGGGGGARVTSAAEQAQIEAANAQKAYYDGLAAQAAQKKQQDTELVRTFFQNFGMEEMWNGAYDYLTQGYSDPTQIAVMLSNNPNYQNAYNARFPAVKMIREENKRRTAQGLEPIAEPAPGTYVALEASYRKALSGLPDDFGFDTKDNIAKWITGEVSATELQDRVTAASNYINYSANPYVKQQLRDQYGMTDAEMAGYVLDQEHTLDYVQKQYQRRLAQSTVGGAADSVGLGLTADQRDLIANNEQFATSFGNAQAGFGKVLEQQDAWQQLAGMSGQTLTTGDLVTDQFGLQGADDIANKKKQLASQERARFGGSSGINNKSLGANTIGGA